MKPIFVSFFSYKQVTSTENLVAVRSMRSGTFWNVRFGAGAFRDADDIFSLHFGGR